MSTVIIKLMPIELMRDMYFAEDRESLARSNLDKYEICNAFEIKYESFEAAEQVFDLTNNPSRQRRREELYGNGRSVSIGDIINIDGIDFLCDRIGFIQL